MCKMQRVVNFIFFYLDVWSLPQIRFNIGFTFKRHKFFLRSSIMFINVFFNLLSSVASFYVSSFLLLFNNYMFFYSFSYVCFSIYGLHRCHFQFMFFLLLFNKSSVYTYYEKSKKKKHKQIKILLKNLTKH